MLGPYANYIGVAFSDTLNRELDRIVRSDAVLQESLVEFDNKSILFDISDLQLKLELRVHDGGATVARNFQEDADLVVRGKLAAFLKSMAADRSSPTKIEGLEINGDMVLAQRLHHVFNRIHIDWEEELAHRVGDVPARYLGNFLRWGKENTTGEQSGIARKTREILVEKTHLIPPRNRVDKFYDDVDTLQADVDRLELRVIRLEQVHS